MSIQTSTKYSDKGNVIAEHLKVHFYKDLVNIVCEYLNSVELDGKTYEITNWGWVQWDCMILLKSIPRIIHFNQPVPGAQCGLINKQDPVKHKYINSGITLIGDVSELHLGLPRRV
jgi:hypothetical protein